MFCLEFSGVQRKTKKILGFFSKNYALNPPVCLFFWNSPFQIIDLNLSCKAFSQKGALNFCLDRESASFSCVLSSASVLGRFICIVHWLTGERITPAWEVKPTHPFPHNLFSHIPNIYNCCKNIIEGKGKSTALQHFTSCF